MYEYTDTWCICLYLDRLEHRSWAYSGRGLGGTCLERVVRRSTGRSHQKQHLSYDWSDARHVVERISGLCCIRHRDGMNVLSRSAMILRWNKCVIIRCSSLVIDVEDSWMRPNIATKNFQSHETRVVLFECVLHVAPLPIFCPCLTFWLGGQPREKAYEKDW